VPCQRRNAGEDLRLLRHGPKIDFGGEPLARSLAGPVAFSNQINRCATPSAIMKAGHGAYRIARAAPRRLPAVFSKLVHRPLSVRHRSVCVCSPSQGQATFVRGRTESQSIVCSLSTLEGKFLGKSKTSNLEPSLRKLRAPQRPYRLYFVSKGARRDRWASLFPQPRRGCSLPTLPGRSLEWSTGGAASRAQLGRGGKPAGHRRRRGSAP
jgi:hypothetical protein